MDSSNQSMNGTYMQYNNGTNFDPNQFYSDMQNFTNGSNDPQPQYDPALFDIPDISSFSQQGQQQQQQQQQSAQPSYNQPTQQRQSQSPAVPQFKAPQQSPYSTQQYGHNVYEQRNIPQSSFDPHLMSRPSASPGPYDRYNFQHTMGFGGQPFDPRFVHYQPQQQASTPTQSFSQQQTQQQPQQPQVSHQYMNIAARPPSQPSPYQMSSDLFSQRADSHQSQQLHGLSYSFSQNQPVSNRFIDPSMLNAGGSIPGSAPESQSRQIQPSPYFSKSGSTIDPRTLQHQLQLPNQMQGLQAPTQSNNSIIPGAVHGQYMQIQLGPQTVEQQKPTNEAPATKKVKSKAKKDGNASSDDDLEIANESEPKPPILIAAKPSDQRGKLIYEIVEAVWSDRNNIASSEKIRSGIANFGDIVRSLRDGWKAQNEALKKAEIPNSPSAANASALKTDVGRYREMMQAVTANAVTSGHPSILKRLGDNQFTMSAMYSFLLDRVNADDYNSDLVKIILMLATRFETLDEEQLEKVKWTKILTRFSKKSTNQSKEFAQKILSNAKAASAKRKADKNNEGPLSPSSTADGKAGSSAAGVKRAREGDSASLPVTKKAIVKPASKPLSVQIAERRKLLEKENAAKSAKADKPTTNGTQQTAATKPKVTAPVKIGPFASLTSASKKPGTTNAERAAANVKDRIDSIKPASPTTTSAAVKRDVPTTDSPPQSKASVATSSASSFLGFLADMDKPKEAQTKKVEEIPDETPDQREKRLRKESRRRLRVSWKPDSELVETKIFEHDPEEETGHEDSMMRDAGDTVREGEMLKRHFDKDEVDDEDEEEDIEDTYSTPSEVDFEVIDAESLGGNFVKCGGPLNPESPSSQAQMKHEEGNLMTMYTPTEQPDTPKEVPSLDDDDDFDPVVDFGEPEEKIRKREQNILSRQQTYETPQPPVSNGVDLSAMLRNLQQQPQPISNPQSSFDLQRSLGMFNQNQQTAPAQQSVLAGLDLQKLLAVSQQFTTMQYGQPAQQYQPPQQQQAASTAAAAPNLQAILAQMQSAQQNQALPVGNGNNPNPFPGSDDQSKKQDSQKKRGKAPIGPDGKPLNYKTQVCSFWKEGKCLKGDACTYRHDE